MIKKTHITPLFKRELCEHPILVRKKLFAKFRMYLLSNLVFFFLSYIFRGLQTIGFARVINKRNSLNSEEITQLRCFS